MTRTSLAAATFVLLAGTSVFAQSAYAQSAAVTMAGGYQMTSADALASKLIGSSVYSTMVTNKGTPASPMAQSDANSADATPAANATGTPASSAGDTNLQQIGTIRDLVLGKDGEVEAVVIGTGGLLGLGEKNVAASYDDLHWSIAQDGSVRGTLDATADSIKSAPDFAYPANGQATTAGAASGMQTASNAAVTTSPAAAVTDPQAFADKAAVSNMFEIQSSQLALTASTTPAVKSFAQRMITDHTAAGQQMQQAAQTDNVSVPTALDSAAVQQLAQLKGLSGAQFDQAFISMQVAAHQDAVALFQGYATSGKDGALKDFAGKTLPTLQMHLTMAQGLVSK